MRQRLDGWVERGCEKKKLQQSVNDENHLYTNESYIYIDVTRVVGGAKKTAAFSLSNDANESLEIRSIVPKYIRYYDYIYPLEGKRRRRKVEFLKSPVR